MKKIPLVSSSRFYRNMVAVIGSTFLSCSAAAITSYPHMNFPSPHGMTLSPDKEAYHQLPDPDKKAFMELVHIVNGLGLDVRDYKVANGNGVIHLNRAASFLDTYSRITDPNVTFFVSLRAVSPGKRGIGPETDRFVTDFFKRKNVFVSRYTGSIIEIKGGSSEVKDSFLPETHHLRIKSHISIVGIGPQLRLSDAAGAIFARHGMDVDYAVKTFIQRPTALSLQKEEPSALDRPWFGLKTPLHPHTKEKPHDAFSVKESYHVLEDDVHR